MGAPPRKAAGPAAPRSIRPAVRTSPKRRRPSVVPRIASTALFLGVFAILAYGVFMYVRTPIVRGFLHNPTIANQFPGVHTMNVMIVGRDYDYNNQDQVIKTNARSDMLMVGRLDFDANSVRFLSIPRDLRARIPLHGVHKINTAHALGGPILAEQTITRNLGIPIDHYVALDFQGFEQAIDLMHGVDIDVDRKMDYDDNWGHLHIHLNPGRQHLAGPDAMGYVRFRHADSDIVRTRRQQALVAAIKARMIQPSTLVAMPAIINTVDKHVVSDLTDDQKIALAKFVRSAPRERVEMQTLPNIEGSYYVYADWPQAAPLIQNWFGVQPPAALARHRLIARVPDGRLRRLSRTQ